LTAVTAVAALSAAAFAAYQIYLSRLSLSVKLLLNLEERFDGPALQKQRSAAVNAIRSNTPDNESNVEDVLDFFETIGLLTHRKALDKEMVWNSFFYWLHGYWRFCRPFIDKQRKTYPARYAELIWLHGKLLAIEEKKYGLLDENEWNGFLDKEGDTAIEHPCEGTM